MNDVRYALFPFLYFMALTALCTSARRVAAAKRIALAAARAEYGKMIETRHTLMGPFPTTNNPLGINSLGVTPARRRKSVLK
jgi:hypothetical protein